MTYFQVDRGLFSSSIWLDGTPEERTLWVWLLGNCEDDGVVRHRELGIADGAKLPRAVVEAALAKFSQPDPDSRTREHEGRRIDRTDDGFVRVLNYGTYRSKDYSTPRWRKWKERQRQHANALAPLAPTPTNATNAPPTKKKNKNKKTNKKPNSNTTHNPNGSEISPRAKKPSSSPEDIARKYIAVRDATFERKTKVLSPDVVKATRERLKDWQGWQIVALPILVRAHGHNTPHSPDVYLRDGSHPRTRNGNTYGGFYWLARTFEKADGTRLDGRLTSIAEQAGVLERLATIGVIANGENPS